jgi:hypothetical protein
MDVFLKISLIFLSGGRFYPVLLYLLHLGGEIRNGWRFSFLSWQDDVTPTQFSILYRKLAKNHGLAFFNVKSRSNPVLFLSTDLGTN